MENHHIPDADNDPEEFSERFLCPVCLDVLYKPIVLSCGHISCFWCVHRSMNGDHKSHCPLCRHPYYHFPTICQLLHSLLLKSYRVAYKRRELEILEQEEKTGMFSPQLDVQAWSSQANQESNFPGESVSKELSRNVEEAVSVSCDQNDGTAVSRPTDGGDYEGMEVKNQQESGSSKRISVADVLCAACKDLVFRPVVLNCGHVYCESCIVDQDEQKLRCQVCPSFHPTGYPTPKVCLELHNFLIEQFPKELAHRRDDVQLKHVNATACESKSSKEAERPSPWSCHAGVGCDYCGMYPIIGDRYRCKDCVEKSGFDLCSDCYNTSSKLPGRFNQQHTAEHQFEHISSNIFRGRGRAMSEPFSGSVSVFLAQMSAISEESDRNGELSHATSTNSEIDEDNQDDSEGSSLHDGI